MNSYTGKTIEFDTVQARYVRLWSAGSTINESNHYAGIQVLGGKRTNGGYLEAIESIAKDKAVTISGTPANPLARITDGNKNTHQWAGIVEDGLQWFQIDLEKPYDITNINIWRYYNGGRTYHDCIVQISNDINFQTGVTTVYNNDTDNSAGLGIGSDIEYPETSAGKSLRFAPVIGRYVRFYSNGSTANGSNHLVEVEVFE